MALPVTGTEHEVTVSKDLLLQTQQREILYFHFGKQIFMPTYDTEFKMRGTKNT